MHFNKKKKAVIIAIIAVGILWGIGYTDINRRFPEPSVESYHAGEWMPYQNMVTGDKDYSLAPVRADVYSYQDFVDTYPTETYQENLSRYKVMVFTVKLKNDGQELGQISRIMGYLMAIAEPIGFFNQGYHVGMEQSNYIEPGQELEIHYYVMVSQAILRDEKFDKLLGSEISLVNTFYPATKKMVFDEVNVHVEQ